MDGKLIELGFFPTKVQAQEAVRAAREMAWNDEKINTLGVVL